MVPKMSLEIVYIFVLIHLVDMVDHWYFFLFLPSYRIHFRIIGCNQVRSHEFTERLKNNFPGVPSQQGHIKTNSNHKFVLGSFNWYYEGASAVPLFVEKLKDRDP